MSPCSPDYITYLSACYTRLMWSRKHKLTGCQSCQTTDIPHRAHGLCRRCYTKANNYRWQKAYQKKHRSRITQYAKEWADANPSAVKRAKRNWKRKNRDKQRQYVAAWRKRNRPPFCIVCGEKRVVDWAHLIPRKDGGPFAPWNFVPLCPTHHRCYDSGVLSKDETAVVQPFLEEAQKHFSALR